MLSPEPHFLVVKLADLGDVLTGTPAMAALRETYPRARIDLLTSAVGAALMEGSPLVDRVLVSDRHRFDSALSLARPGDLAHLAGLVRALRHQRYHTALIMHHLTSRWGAIKWRALASCLGADQVAGLDNGRGQFLDLRVPDLGFGARHETEYGLALARAAGATVRDQRLRLHIPDEARREASRLLAPSHGRLVAVHPGSGSFSLARRWPADRFARVAEVLASRHGVTILLLGGPADDVAQVRAELTCPFVDLSSRTSVLVLAAVIERCALFLGNDSGVMHLATATGIPLVAIFGPSNADAWGPWRPPGPGASPLAVVQGECPYGGPCLYVGHRLGSKEGCRDRPCLASVTPEQVLQAVEALDVL